VQPTDPEVLRILGLRVAAAGLVGVLCVALGAVLRSTAGAVASRVSQGLPALRVGEDTFLAVSTPWPVGMGILVAWAAGTCIAGAALLDRRDV